MEEKSKEEGKVKGVKKGKVGGREGMKRIVCLLYFSKILQKWYGYYLKTRNGTLWRLEGRNGTREGRKGSILTYRKGRNSSEPCRKERFTERKERVNTYIGREGIYQNLEGRNGTREGRKGSILTYRKGRNSSEPGRKERYTGGREGKVQYLHRKGMKGKVYNLGWGGQGRYTS